MFERSHRRAPSPCRRQPDRPPGGGDRAGGVGGGGATAYAGVLSVGGGHTLQLVAPRWAVPAHAPIILRLGAGFAALAGWVVVGETLGPRALAGCALMLGGMLLAQLAAIRSRR